VDVDRKLVGDALERLALKRLVTVGACPEEERKGSFERGRRRGRRGGRRRAPELERPASGQEDREGAQEAGEREREPEVSPGETR